MGALTWSAVSYEVVTSLSSSSTLISPVSLLVRRLPRGHHKSILRRFDPRLVVLFSSAVLYREVKMFAIATAALLVFAVSAQAAKYDYGSYESAYYGRDAYSAEPRYTYKQTTMYRPTYKQSHELRYRRDVREGQKSGECIRVCTPDCIDSEECSCEIVCSRNEMSNLFTDREAQEFPSCRGMCIDQGPTGPQPACRDTSAAAGGRNFCYVSEFCKDVKRSIISPEHLWSVDACCGKTPC